MVSVQEVLVTCTTSLFGIAVVPGSEGGPRGNSIRFRPRNGASLVLLDGDVRQVFSCEEQNTIKARVLFRCRVATSASLVPVEAGHFAPSRGSRSSTA